MAYLETQINQHLSAQPLHKTELDRFVRFAVVGGIGTFVDFGALFILKEMVGLPLIVANSLSYVTGIVNNFLLNRIWTYPDAREKTALRQFVLFSLISLMGLLLNNLIVGWLAAPMDTLLNMPGTGYMAAKVLATGIVLVWNFTANRLWTFNA